ncbi:MAG: 3-oxoacyl-[acyl-carrier protein] reductase [Candidatus Ozemobacter sibiricus]|jgi:3-oxoacyl-[acyl-carrier protein] reductase|uniref:3-oxoacyl-[acyl-carrier protein] reductase n=1 Tax=Candidatus Ozemobacter sibiricus TaxID=2268124 RepID=A0A367ZKM9_9BACT|nr:MAG: 3-oxoacyl-[acyl-carrier protein] reductase [Candidatus Ozemobacter sibiricus]
MDLELRGTTAFVAGSSRGIGLAIARAFLQEGASVVLTGRQEDTLSEAADRLALEFPDRDILPLAGNLIEPELARARWATAWKRFGAIDTLVANVGTENLRNVPDPNPEDWALALALNLHASMNIVRPALASMTERGSGSIIFISSIAGLEALDAPMTYGAAKAALGSAAKALSRLVGAKGVRVNVVAPGNIFHKDGLWDRKRTENPEAVARMLETEVPLRRFGTPEEVADAVLFLASRRASFITGACLVVDGGQTRSSF